jgi:hypothetical protein
MEREISIIITEWQRRESKKSLISYSICLHPSNEYADGTVRTEGFSSYLPTLSISLLHLFLSIFRNFPDEIKRRYFNRHIPVIWKKNAFDPRGQR